MADQKKPKKRNIVLRTFGPKCQRVSKRNCTHVRDTKNNKCKCMLPKGHETLMDHGKLVVPNHHCKHCGRDFEE